MKGDKCYFDTSALLPYYREEASSQQVDALLQALKPPVLVSELTRVEMVSAIGRWVRMDEIDESQAVLLENTINEDIASGLFLVRSVGRMHYQQAGEWLSSRKTALRTLDALHLSCCQTFQAQLVTCDIVMHRAALCFGIDSKLLQ